MGGATEAHPADPPMRNGQVFQSQLAAQMPPKGKVRVQYLGAIRVSDHARFTWRVFANEGEAVFNGVYLRAEGPGPRIYDLQLVTMRDEKKNVWVLETCEAVTIVDDNGKKIKNPSVVSAKSTAWRNRGAIPETTAIDEVIEVLQKGEFVKDIPIARKDQVLLAKVKGEKPGEDWLSVRFEYDTEPDRSASAH